MYDVVRNIFKKNHVPAELLLGTIMEAQDGLENTFCPDERLHFWPYSIICSVLRSTYATSRIKGDNNTVMTTMTWKETNTMINRTKTWEKLTNPWAKKHQAVM